MFRDGHMSEVKMQPSDASSPRNDSLPEEEEEKYELSLPYKIELTMYGIAIVLGFAASVYTIHKFRRCYKKNMDVAARLISYKISISVADALVLFVYAPTQFLWIMTFWWYVGDILCRVYKFTAAFAFYLTGNMQVLIAFDRLIMMARLNKVRAKGTSEYNTRLFLSLAWILAFLASLPQLAIFKLVYSDQDEPQCSSIWNEYAVRYQRDEEQLLQTLEHDGANETAILEIAAASKQDWMRILEWEQTYNIVHISMVIILPYVLELILYMLILSLLSDAEKGEFSGIRRFIRRKIVRMLNWAMRKETSKDKNLISMEEENVVVLPCPLVVHSRKISRSANSSPTRELCLEQLREGLAIQEADVESRRATMFAQGRVSLHPMAAKHQLNRQRSPIRRASHPVRAREEVSPRAPWVRKVKVVRQNARKKACIMLTFNLLLWLPYCVHGILSSFVELNFINFQFACALVVFNAITNILL
ncbi:hypothetical protein PMAYCL1PPCAC_16571 [Pristionchus mayeri]|uniref:G-protein coupled receptors family 1 profile domain-containing protein n=1 Tax=Pristionchus mayeri TaxID=1317129 RepID=A0AAN5CL47_9BILA|nr:hypothetical protein PMAYCL1PPCAC_16571 [Pristionchus mayeri]